MNMQPRIAHVSALRETADVWCLTVPDDHCFSLENGAVVHNCADAFGLMAIDYQEPRQSIEWQRPIAARYGTIA